MRGKGSLRRDAGLRRPLYAVGVALVLAVGALTAAALTGGGEGRAVATEHAHDVAQGGAPTTVAEHPAEADAHKTKATARKTTIVVGDDFFRPQKLQIRPGDTVVWENTGSNPHTVSADDGSFDSGTLGAGASYSHRFERPGMYFYYCRLHGVPRAGMWGVIVVAKTRKAVAVDVPAPAPTGGSVSVPAGSRVHHVAAADGDAFSPQRLTVAAGDTVVWTNRDSRLHTVTADGGLFDSGSLAPSGRFSHTFRRTGTLAYYCRLHGSPGEGMWGVVVVTKAGGGGGGGGGGAAGGAGGGGGGSEPSPTLVVTRAEYDPDDHELRIEAESSSAALVVRAYVAATGNLIGRLANEGGGDYRSEFTWPSNPRRIRIESNLGGSATSGVEVK